MAKLKVSDSKMKERGYVIGKKTNQETGLSTKVYNLEHFVIRVYVKSDGSSIVWTNNDEQKHDIDLDELEYLEEIYK